MLNANRFLVISRIGAQSLHDVWLGHAEDRGYDVLLSAYEASISESADDGVFFEFRPGTKVAGYGEVFRAHADMIACYDYVALLDDDLTLSPADLRKLFEICALHDFKIAQPSLTHDSHFTFAALLHDPNWRLRYVNYIEMMCPVFRRDVLQEIAPLYELGYESGIDLIWCNAVSTSLQDFAVIDDVQVRHTRPVGSLKSANGFVGARRYEDDIHALLARFGLPWLSCLPYAGVRRGGIVVRRRAPFLWSAIPLLFAIGRQRGWRQRARSVAVYWKHLLTRRALNLPLKVALPAS